MRVYYITFFIFLSVSLLIFGVYRYYTLDAPRTRLINKRLDAIKSSGTSDKELELLRNRRGLSFLQGNIKYANINRWLIQTGIEFNEAFFAKAIFFVALFSLFLCFVSRFDIKIVFVSPAISIVLICFYLSRMRRNRIAKFEEQLPDALDIIARSLRAGHPTQIAISLASRECFDPLGSEFGYTSDEIRLGLDITSALRNMSERVGLPDLVYVEAAIAVQSQSGGSLASVVTTLSRIIRERFKLKQKIAALTSEGRASGLVLTILPIAIACAVGLINPSYYLDVYQDPLFQNSVIAAIIFLVIGHLWIQSMLKFKF